MTFVEIRNKLIERLWDFVGCPVILSDQVQPEAEFPYGVYSATSYIPQNGMGDYTEKYADGDITVTRTEMPYATFSFTFCSMNRTGENGEPISGADEAEMLASKAVGYFQHSGYDDFASLGIAVVDVSQTQNRTTLVIDEAARRVGFDVRIRYTRQDTRKVSTIEKIPFKEKE